MIKIDNIVSNLENDLREQIELFNKSTTAARIYLNNKTREIQTITYQTLNDFTEFNNDVIVLLAKENGVQENVTPDDVLRVAERSLRFVKK
ncbi:hypothetical protein [Lacicoccus qingdaonensis]|uniref:Uncharacterized protein n=1 Tax=Lacicoccus qingdaonensis TaxID=576118 RepID=A0A1G9CTH8_9BACL|nr:hypothetical protein [Salinicoccus qingdaonensis]SDK54956.1 hypothetical protein SAMN05216216_104178 [Salinicoccus qingdaonensis]